MPADEMNPEERERYLDSWEMDCRPGNSDSGVTAGEEYVPATKKLKAKRRAESTHPEDQGDRTDDQTD